MILTVINHTLNTEVLSYSTISLKYDNGVTQKGTMCIRHAVLPVSLHTRLTLCVANTLQFDCCLGCPLPFAILCLPWW